MPMKQCADVPMNPCADVPMKQCDDVPMKLCADEAMYQLENGLRKLHAKWYKRVYLILLVQ